MYLFFVFDRIQLISVVESHIVKDRIQIKRERSERGKKERPSRIGKRRDRCWIMICIFLKSIAINIKYTTYICYIM